MDVVTRDLLSTIQRWRVLDILPIDKLRGFSRLLSRIIIPHHHLISSSHIIISYHHLIPTSHIIISYHHLVSSSHISSCIDISYHHIISYHIIIPYRHLIGVHVRRVMISWLVQPCIVTVYEGTGWLWTMTAEKVYNSMNLVLRRMLCKLKVGDIIRNITHAPERSQLLS